MPHLRYLTSLDPMPLVRGHEVQPDGTVIVPLRQRVRVGRGRHCEVVFNCGRIAREEFVIEPTAEGWVVIDSGTNQGMLVNGTRSRRHRFAPGDRVLLGQVLFEFVDAFVPAR